MAAKRIATKASDTDAPVPRPEEKPVPAGVADLSGLANVEVEVTLELGRTEITLEEASQLGADAIINVRFMTSQVMSGAAEMLAYGTAVTLKE